LSAVPIRSMISAGISACFFVCQNPAMPHIFEHTPVSHRATVLLLVLWVTIPL
jgi:hypothetical protein